MAIASASAAAAVARWPSSLLLRRPTAALASRPYFFRSPRASSATPVAGLVVPAPLSSHRRSKSRLATAASGDADSMDVELEVGLGDGDGSEDPGHGAGGGGGDGEGVGGGGNFEDGDEGEPEKENNKEVAAAAAASGMSMSQKLTLAYAALVGVGGIMGYVKSGSQKSLAAGLLAATALYFVYTQLPVNPAFASSVGLGLSAALLVVMGSRFKRSGKIFPAGVVSLVSLVMTGGYFHGILRGLHA